MDSVIEGLLMLLAFVACGTLAFYMVKGIVDVLRGKMR